MTFGTAALSGVACCAPAAFLLISRCERILNINRKARFGNGEEEGPNDATIRSMAEVNALVGVLLRAVEIGVLGTAMFANLTLNEMNQLNT